MEKTKGANKSILVNLTLNAFYVFKCACLYSFCIADLPADLTNTERQPIAALFCNPQCLFTFIPCEYLCFYVGT